LFLSNTFYDTYTVRCQQECDFSILGRGGKRAGRIGGVLAAICVSYPPKSVEGGVGGEGKLGCQEEEEGSKRRRRILVRGGPVEGEWEEGGKTTLTQYELIMQDLRVEFLLKTDSGPGIPGMRAFFFIHDGKPWEFPPL